MNLDNIPTLGHGGATDYKTNSKTWQKKTVRDIIKDVRVIGTANHLKKENYFPVIISQDVFNRAQHRLTLRAAAKPTGGPVDTVGNLFTSICRCVHCGKMMGKTITNKTYKGKVTRYEYLVCEGARSGNKCSYKAVHYSHMEWSFLTLLGEDDFFAAVSGSENKAENNLAAKQGELETVERQIVKLEKLVLGDENPSTTLVASLKEFEANPQSVIRDDRETSLQLENGSKMSKIDENIKDWFDLPVDWQINAEISREHHAKIIKLKHEISGLTKRLYNKKKKLGCYLKIGPEFDK